jgi:hypothetical protein
VVELIFMMLVLKIPVIYLGVVCWWAIKAEPRPLEPALLPAIVPEPGAPWMSPAHRPRRGGPHGGPDRRYARVHRARRAVPRA